MKRQVALIVETSSAYGRDLLAGIIRYTRLHKNWMIYLEERDLTKQPPDWLHHWRGDGIISRATTPELLAAVAETGIPFVEVTDRRSDSELLQVRSDDEEIGRLGAEHLLDRGFRRFGFCGYSGEAWSKRRELGFAEALQKAGFGYRCYESVWQGKGARSWYSERNQLKEWIREMEVPHAVMACNDVRGVNVVEACCELGVSVPEQVAVLGVDNDELLCQVCSPPLTSIIPNAPAVGFKAAELLTRLMDGETPGSETHTVPPQGILTRQSTDVVAIENREVAKAVEYIRENACRGLTVNEVVSHCGLSRSTLERQVRKFLGKTPQEAIRQEQIKRAKELLVTTDLSVEKIAIFCGFEHPEYFYAVFKRVSGTTTSEFRRRPHVH